MHRHSLTRTVGTVAAAVLLAGSTASAGPVKVKLRDHRADKGRDHRASHRHEDRRGDHRGTRAELDRCASFPGGMFHGGDRHDRRNDDYDRAPAPEPIARGLCGSLGNRGHGGGPHAFNFGAASSLIVLFGDGWSIIVLPPGFHGRLNALMNHHRGGPRGIAFLLGNWFDDDGRWSDDEDDDDDRRDHRRGRGGDRDHRRGGGGGDGDMEDDGSGPPRPVTPIPLPTPALLAGAGLAGLVARRRRPVAG